MNVYHVFKNLFMRFIMESQVRLLRFILVMHYRKLIKSKFKNKRIAELSKDQKKEIRLYYKSQGYNNVKLSWYQFFIASNTIFSTKYIPDYIFHPFFEGRLNSSRQWTSLLDKNLLEVLFKDDNQPQSVVKNMNGVFYMKNKLVSEKMVIDELANTTEKLVIKPSIESGGGKQVFGFYIKDSVTTHKNLSIPELLKLFKKNFIIQRVLSQNTELKALNPSSLNTLRVLSYLKNNEVYIISAILRIGKPGMFTDNNSGGGVACGVDENGCLKEYGYYSNGNRIQKTGLDFDLKGFPVPYYDLAIKMVKEIHTKVPYFKIVSWDIAIDEDNEPVLIEYNTYQQDIRIHQLANGPALCLKTF